jgi:ABC-type spermidine/putrescine transport systems, ATPase components
MKNNHILHSITFQKLKHLHDVTIFFDEKPITALMGPNCCGKTTILHALACCFQPDENIGENHRFPVFFTPSTYERWNESSFEIDYSYNDKDKTFSHQKQPYSKSDRWVPKYERRPERPIFYIGIDTCVPLIENETQQSMINFTEVEKNDANHLKILECMSEIFNKNYSNVYELNRFGKIHKGVSCSNVKYSELTMGAGEQRIYKILEKVINGPKYALFLIDEIDLLMHQFALAKLLDQLLLLLTDKKQQLVFTSHNQYIASRTKDIKVIHIFNTLEKTFILKDTNLEAIYRLSGYQKDLRRYELYVEDFVSSKLVESVLLKHSVKKHCNIIQYGPAVNAFTIAAGTILIDRNLDYKYFILDGDVQSKEEEIEKNISKVLTGNVEPYIQYRAITKTRIIKYTLEENQSPEELLSILIKELSDDELDETGKQIKTIQYLRDKHKYVSDLQDVIGITKEQAINCLITNAQKNAAKWDLFIAPIERMAETICEDIARI